MNYLLPERLDRLAAEYALGTLSGPARRRFERVVRAFPAAALAVAVWQERLSVLDLNLAPIQPPASAWRRLERRLFGPPLPTSVISPTLPKKSWRNVFSLHALGGVLAGGLLCALLVHELPGALNLEARVDAVPASYVGLLLDKSARPMMVASSRRHGRLISVKILRPLALQSGDVAQLWALPKAGTAPFPIGTVPLNGSASIALPDTSERLFSAVSQLAISVEKSPSKAGDAPTGEFIAIGHCVKVW